eukprot:360598-Chlamydomonas_euryale.AAC.7
MGAPSTNGRTATNLPMSSQIVAQATVKAHSQSVGGAPTPGKGAAAAAALELDAARAAAADASAAAAELLDLNTRLEADLQSFKAQVCAVAGRGGGVVGP